METRITLESLKAEFEKWRREKRAKSEAIPEELWDKAMKLYPEYAASQICWQLRLEKKRLLKRLAEKGEPEKKNGGFLQVQVERRTGPGASFVCERIEVERADGSRLRFYGHGAFEFGAGELVSSFLGGEPCCL